MDPEVFGHPEVMQAMSEVVRQRPDVTEYDAQDRVLLERLQVPGPPTLLFFGTDEAKRQGRRIVGAVGPEAFLHHLRQTFEGV